MWKRFGQICASFFSAIIILSGANVAWAACDIEPQIPPGGFTWPMQGDVTNSWSYDCLTDAGHRGIDISSAPGAIINAAAAGIVSFVGYTPAEGGGITVTIDHQGGLRTTYLHITLASVQKGQSVSGGEQLGTSIEGRLHFGIKQPGTHAIYFDPLGLLPPLPATIDPSPQNPQPATDVGNTSSESSSASEPIIEPGSVPVSDPVASPVASPEDSLETVPAPPPATVVTSPQDVQPIITNPGNTISEISSVSVPESDQVPQIGSQPVITPEDSLETVPAPPPATVVTSPQDVQPIITNPGNTISEISSVSVPESGSDQSPETITPFVISPDNSLGTVPVPAQALEQKGAAQTIMPLADAQAGIATSDESPSPIIHNYLDRDVAKPNDSTSEKISPVSSPWPLSAIGTLGAPRMMSEPDKQPSPVHLLAAINRTRPINHMAGAAVALLLSILGGIGFQLTRKTNSNFDFIRVSDHT